MDDLWYTEDFGLPHRDSADGKAIEYPITLDKSLLSQWREVPPLPEGLRVSSRKDPIRTSGYYLIPPEPLGEVARVFQIGAEKYEPRGWEKGIPWSDIADRIFKHYGRWARGEKFDLEDGQHNLASVAWAALVLMEYERTHPELDDIHATPASS